MKVLAISGRHEDAAAAIAEDGQIVAAATEDSFTRIRRIGYDRTGGVPIRAVQACLQAARVPIAAIDRVAIVRAEATDTAGVSRDRPEPASRLVRGIAPSLVGEPVPSLVEGLPEIEVDAITADAVQAAASSADDSAVLICSASPAGLAMFRRAGGALDRLPRPGGSDRFLKYGAAGAAALGVAADRPFESIDRLAVGGEPEYEPELADVLAWREGDLHFDAAQFDVLVRRLGGEHQLDDAGSMNVHVQGRRRAMAASLASRAAAVISDIADDLRRRTGAGAVTFGGDLFANSRLNAELSRQSGQPLSVAAVPEPAGRALGAALSPAAIADRGVAGLALGPSFPDAEIKQALDNCRLEYLYEPDWPRVFDRVSRMLAQGKIVAWFQGAMGFGPRAMGTRSVLCDPSSRYARHNMNEYLRHLPLDEPLPVAFAPAAAARCLGPAGVPLAVQDVPVRPEWQQPLAGALDWRQHVRVHPVNATHAPLLCTLLDAHFQATGVPALIETNLSAAGEPTACTPRDAVRCFYSSAIDVLVIGQFLLMKDHWLLRSHAG